MYKIKTLLTPNTHKLLEPYLFKRKFAVRCTANTSEDHIIEAGTPQGIVLGTTLYLLYTADIPSSDR